MAWRSSPRAPMRRRREAVIDEVTAIITGFGKVPIPGEPEG